MEVTAGLTGTSRADFLETAAASRGNVSKLVKILKPLSQDDQQSFVDLTKGLGKKSLEKLIKGSASANEEFLNFISLAKELKETARTGFDYFLFAAEDASSKDLKDLVTSANKLGVRQQTQNRSGA